MRLSRSTMLAIAFVLASAALGVWAYAVLPADARIAIHYNAGLRPDGYADKAHGLFILPLVAAVVTLSLSAAGAINFRGRVLERSPEVYGALVAGVPAVLFAAQGAIVAHAFDPRFDVLRAAFLAVGALLVVLGNVLGKLRQNFVIGVRTPFSLTDAENWDKTHRFTGRLMFAAGLLLIPISVFTPSHGLMIALMVALTAGPLIAGLVYSYRIGSARRDAATRANS